MMLVALILTTFTLVLLPLLPTFAEWLRPSDVTALPIDGDDAQEPHFFERKFITRLRGALQANDESVNDVELVSCGTAGLCETLPLSPQELEVGSSDRVWHGLGDLQLPPQIHFSAEVAATQNLQTGDHGNYRALWAGGVAQLAERTNVRNWVHGNVVQTQEYCQVGGRITADECIRLGMHTTFSLLHAPLIETSSSDAWTPRPKSQVARKEPNWPAEMRWNSGHRIGRIVTSLEVGAHSTWTGDVVCQSDCRVGGDCEIFGSIKARGTLLLGRGCRVVGNVFAQGEIVVGEDCVISGTLVSETAVHLGSGSTVGLLAQPTTLSAPLVVLHSGVRVHGTIWAEKHGVVQSSLSVGVIDTENSVASVREVYA